MELDEERGESLVSGLGCALDALDAFALDSSEEELDSSSDEEDICFVQHTSVNSSIMFVLFGLPCGWDFLDRFFNHRIF